MKQITSITKDPARGKTTIYSFRLVGRQRAVSIMREQISKLRVDDKLHFTNGLTISKEFRVHPEDDDLAMKGLKHRRRHVLVVIYKDIEKEYILGAYKKGY